MSPCRSNKRYPYLIPNKVADMDTNFQIILYNNILELSYDACITPLNLVRIEFICTHTCIYTPSHMVVEM